MDLNLHERTALAYGRRSMPGLLGTQAEQVLNLIDDSGEFLLGFGQKPSNGNYEFKTMDQVRRNSIESSKRIKRMTGPELH
jgi:hypothetical protein